VFPQSRFSLQVYSQGACLRFDATCVFWHCTPLLQMKNVEDRTAVMSRAIEIMHVLKRLNNFNGLLEFNAAFNASAIHRLNLTKAVRIVLLRFVLLCVVSQTYALFASQICCCIIS